MAEEFKRRTAYKISIGLILSSMEAIHFDENQRFKFIELSGRDIYRVNLIANVIDKFESSQKPYANITLDDGTGNIRVKAFADSVKILQGTQLGDTILLVGVLRYYNDELYIMPEIVKPLDPKWLVARKLELEDEYGEMYSKTRGYGYSVQEEKEKEIKEGDLDMRDREKNNQVKNNQEISNFVKQERITDTLGKEEGAGEVVDEVQEMKIGPGVRDKIFDLIKGADSEGGLDIDKIIMALKEPVEQINKEITELLEDGTIYEPKPGRLRVL